MEERKEGRRKGKEKRQGGRKVIDSRSGYNFPATKLPSFPGSLFIYNECLG